MSTGVLVLLGLVMLVGLVGIVVPILPGTLLIAAALLVWAILDATAAGWAVFAVAMLLLVASGVVKYAWPGRRMRDAGVPGRSVIFGGLVGIVGFFVVPVVGLLLGFLLGTYVAEAARHRTHRDAWTSTVHATKAVGLSILVELFGALLAVGLWLGAVLAL
ncbi:DUF456 domain-containing protein [Prescottella equi]|uniref:DUF456 domain-containing protein n=1 Tax=Rhodococcus hoagii TaxID=43767 RepID=UPI0019DF3AD5|nr:DUF456 domain-containing protein [Prescottella equi]MBM4472389.1 DUF456 family protein [Prescottella equi]NKS84231.1 DUF456 family protein [Prescottella equi]UNQ38991.1 DUF456 domain-containing protein [Prescottella equi]